MRIAFGKVALVMAAVFALAACSDRAPRLMNLASTTSGPDEFAILPPKALQQPEDISSLPIPTPGGTNITDPTPRQDAVAALGGNPERLTQSGIRAGEGALVSHASRYGVSPTIRADLAAADLEWRRDNNGRVLERLFNVSVYFKAYKRMALDQYQELERFRRLGIWTPAVPPDPAG